MFQFRSAKRWSRWCFPTPRGWRARLPRWCAGFDENLARTRSMTTTALDRRTSLSIFERMLMMRHFEEAVIALYKQGRFVSHYHIYIGQEATGGAVLEALGEKDLICTTHPNHGHIIGRGCDPNRTMAEILGRATGFNGGRAGTLHIADPSPRVLSTSAIRR